MNRIEILNDCPIDKLSVGDTIAGRIYECIEGTCTGSVGAIVMRTGTNEWPFLDLRTGQLWGKELRNYRFKEVESSIKLTRND